MRSDGPRNVIFFGDSVCAGQGVSPQKSWVTRLSQSIADRFGDGVLVINSSVNGNTTRMALERIGFDAQSHGLVLMILQFGLNDCNYWETDGGHPRVSPDAFRANLLEIADRAATFGAKRTLLNTNHPTLLAKKMPVTGRPYQEGNDRYNDIIRSVAQKRDDIRLIDVDAAFNAALSNGQQLGDLLSEDGLHLSGAGNDLYLSVVGPEVLSALSEILEGIRAI